MTALDSSVAASGLKDRPGHYLAVRIEASVGIYGVAVPPLDSLISPRADARTYEDVEVLGVVLGPRLEEADCPLNPRGLVSVHAARDENARLVVGPVLRPSIVHDVLVRILGQTAVTVHVEALLERIHLRDDLLRIRPLDDSRGAPF